jgi:hypothetical protein
LFIQSRNTLGKIHITWVPGPYLDLLTDSQSTTGTISEDLVWLYVAEL